MNSLAKIMMSIAALSWATPALCNSETPELELDLARGCRTIFPISKFKADGKGRWWITKRSNSKNILCILGTLHNLNISPIGKAIQTTNVHYVVVRSSGGPSRKWLQLAETLEKHQVHLVIDDLCLSACAVYLPPIATKVTAVMGSVLAWHGGVSPKTLEESFGKPSSIQEILTLAELEQRTSDLYERHFISTRILSDSTIKTDGRVLDKVLSGISGYSRHELAIIGYAYSPETLKVCFGFDNIHSLWHGGDDLAIARLVYSRNPKFIALESAKSKNGKRKCLANKL